MDLKRHISFNFMYEETNRFSGSKLQYNWKGPRARISQLLINVNVNMLQTQQMSAHQNTVVAYSGKDMQKEERGTMQMLKIMG